jgi:ATP synthase protein I
MNQPSGQDRQPGEREPERDRSPRGGVTRRQQLALAGAGLELAGVVVILTLGGWWLDGRLGTGPWLVLIGAFVGIVGSLYKLWRVGKRFAQR